MRIGLLIAAFTLLVVNGQEPKPHSNTDKRNAAAKSEDTANSTTGQTVVVVNQQTPEGQQDNHTKQPKSSYFDLLLPSNIANTALVLVGFAGIVIGVCTLRIIGKQVAAAEKSAEAARESIVLTHRPKVLVRDMVVAWRPLMHRGTCVRKLNANQFDDWQLAGAFYIVNIGNQAATVVSSEQFLFFGHMLPLERPYESGTNRQIVTIKLKPGQAQKIPFHPLAIGESETTLIPGGTMIAIGRIAYEDELGNRRETGFARQFNWFNSRFVAIGDPDYEYAD